MSMYMKDARDYLSENTNGCWKRRSGLEQKLIIVVSVLFAASLALSITVIVLNSKVPSKSPENEGTTVPPSTADTTTTTTTNSTTVSSLTADDNVTEVSSSTIDDNVTETNQTLENNSIDIDKTLETEMDNSTVNDATTSETAVASTSQSTVLPPQITTETSTVSSEQPN